MTPSQPSVSECFPAPRPSLDVTLDAKFSLSDVANRLLVGDARVILPKLPDGLVALIHTSPPYNIEKKYAHTDDDLEHHQYVELLEDVFSCCYRVLKPGGSLFFQTGYSQNGGDEIFPIDMLSYKMFHSIGFRLWDRIIWHYRGGMSFTRKFKNTHETILWWVKPNLDRSVQPYFEVDGVRERSRSYDKRNNLYGKNPGNVWSADRVAFGGKARDTSHIAIYPEIITERIIRACSKPGDVVMDPFAGSGTTPAMARALGREWLGIEISPTYASEAQRRIGSRQACPVATLAASLIKVLAFSNRNGSQQLEAVGARLSAWLKGVRFEHYDEILEEKLGPVFEGVLLLSPQLKSAKPGAWAFFDDFFEIDWRKEPLVMASILIDSAYPERERWNGIRKYLDSLETLKEVVKLAHHGIGSLVSGVIRAEPSSFTADDAIVRFNGKTISLPKKSDGLGKDSVSQRDPTQGSLFS